MGLEVKICGITDSRSLEAAVRGARFIGFVFFDLSPRALTPGAAGRLARSASKEIDKVGVFVDAPDGLIEEAVMAAGLDYIQLHGTESPERVSEVRRSTGRRVIKALPVAQAEDLAKADAYADVCDYLLFDARPPAGSARPGGNARPFDWGLLKDRQFRRPWLLSGGLTADNLATAVGRSGARMVDVSSGVERAPGIKSPRRIRAFLESAHGLEEVGG